ncbi:36813_t:CDS:2, partial [Gigaspora margarita]
ELLFSELNDGWPMEEEQLYEWVISVYQDGLAVTYLNLRVKMVEILSESAKQTQDITKKAVISNFKSEDHFIYGDEDDKHSNENSNDYKDGSEVEFDDNEKSDEDKEFYENESSNQFNNWPE